MSYKRSLPSNDPFETPLKRPRTLTETPKTTSRSSSSSLNRTRSAYDTFPAPEFDAWIEGIKAKASAALLENEALDEQFKRARRVEEEITLKRLHERERIANYIQKQVQDQEDEQVRIEQDITHRADKVVNGKSATTTINVGFDANSSDSDSQGSFNDCDNHLDGPDESESYHEDGQSSHHDDTVAVNLSDDDNESEEIEGEDEEEFDSQDELTALTPKYIAGLEEDDDRSYTSENESISEQAHENRNAKDQEYTEQEGSEQEEEEEREEEEALDEEYSGDDQDIGHNVTGPLEIDSSEGENDSEEQDLANTLELNTEERLFTDEEEDDFEAEDADAFETESGLHDEPDTLSYDEIEKEEEMASATYESDADGDADAPEAFVENSVEASTYDTEASRDWLRQDHYVEQSLETASRDQEQESYEDQEKDIDLVDSKSNQETLKAHLSGVEHDLHQIPVVHAAHESMHSDALTEEELEDEKYHMWKDEMTRSDALQPIEEEEEKLEDETTIPSQTPEANVIASVPEIIHSHPTAHPGHEHEHHAHTMESTTEELHPEILPTVSAHEIQDETERNFEVVADLENVVTSIREKDTFDEPMTLAKEAALEPEIAFLAELDKNSIPSTHGNGMDNLSELPDDLSFEADDSEDNQSASDSDANGNENDEEGNLEDFLDDSNADMSSMSEGANDRQDPEIVEDEGSIQYDMEDSDESNIINGAFEASSDEHELDSEENQEEQIDHIRMETRDKAGDESDEDAVNSEVVNKELDLVHVLRDGAEYVDEEDSQSHHYAPKLQNADARNKHRRHPSKTSES